MSSGSSRVRESDAERILAASCARSSIGRARKARWFPGVARVAAECLVVDVTGAERIPVHEHHPISHDLDDVRLVDQLAAGTFRERIAEQKVVIAADQVDGNTGGDGLGKRGLDLGVGRAVVIVAEPQDRTRRRGGRGGPHAVRDRKETP